MRILLTGATGTAGSGALRAAIADPRVKGITVLSRRAPRETHRKMRFVQHDDFTDYRPVQDALLEHDAALWCLGTSQNRVDRTQLHRITVDFVVAGAKAFRAANPGSAFLHLSGSGADPTGKSRLAFAQEKGQAEAALDALRLPRLWHLRPGYIHPGAPLAQPLLQDRIMKPLAPLLRPFKAAMVDADDLGHAMLEVARNGAPQPVLDNRTIRELALRARQGIPSRST